MPPPPSPSPPVPLFTWDFDTPASRADWQFSGEASHFPWSAGSHTPSRSTGPQTGDHTGGGSFFYIEASYPRQPGDTFDLTYSGSACAGTSVGRVSFWYHMYGGTIGSLTMRDENGMALWYRSGSQGNRWVYVSVNVRAASLTFQAVRGSSWSGDIAIDDVQVQCAQPVAWSLRYVSLQAGTMTKVLGADRGYDAYAFSRQRVDRLTMIAPARDSSNRNFFRICLTPYVYDRVTCNYGVMAGLWASGAIYTMCKGADGSYRGAASEKDVIELRTYAGSGSVYIRKNGITLRTCRGLDTANLYAKVWFYARGSSLKTMAYALA